MDVMYATCGGEDEQAPTAICAIKFAQHFAA